MLACDPSIDPSFKRPESGFSSLRKQQREEPCATICSHFESEIRNGDDLIGWILPEPFELMLPDNPRRSNRTLPFAIDEHLPIIGDLEDGSGIIDDESSALFVAFASRDRACESKFALNLRRSFVLRDSWLRGIETYGKE